MRRHPLRDAAAIVAVLAVVSTAMAQQTAPRLIPFQGRVTDLSGNPVNGLETVTFTIYDAATNGLSCWDEVQPGVSIVGGQISVFLGAIRSLDDPGGGKTPVCFGPAGSGTPPAAGKCGCGDKYLGIKLGLASNQEMVPRHQLVPAFHARRADIASAMADGAVMTTMIANASVVNEKLASDAVSTDKIAAGAVTREKLDPALLPEEQPVVAVAVATDNTNQSDPIQGPRDGLAWNTELWDTDNMFAGGGDNSDFTIRRDGHYLVTLNVEDFSTSGQLFGFQIILVRPTGPSTSERIVIASEKRSGQGFVDLSIVSFYSLRQGDKLHVLALAAPVSLEFFGKRRFAAIRLQ